MSWEVKEMFEDSVRERPMSSPKWGVMMMRSQWGGVVLGERARESCPSVARLGEMFDKAFHDESGGQEGDEFHKGVAMMTAERGDSGVRRGRAMAVPEALRR